MTAFLTIFRRFQTTSRRLPKILKNCSEGQTNVPEHFLKISGNSVPRLPKTFEEDLVMFRSYTNEFKYNLRDKVDISEIIGIFTSYRIWKMRHLSPGCSLNFVGPEFYECYIFQ